MVKNRRLVFTPAPAVGKHAAGKAHDAPEVAIVKELALGLDKRCFIGAEKHPFIKHNTAASALLQAVNDVLEKKHLGCPGLIGKPGLRILALLAAKWRIHQDHIIERRSIRE